MSAEPAFLALAAHLKRQNYTFICPTPESHGKVVAKRIQDPERQDVKNLEDLFGWSLKADRNTIDRLLSLELLKQLLEASIIIHAESEDRFKSEYRLSNLYLPHIQDGTSVPQMYYIHSAFPTTQPDAVFFGPDTYLFLDFLTQASRYLGTNPRRAVVDVCCGSGAGAIHMARSLPSSTVIGLDLNPKALALGKINAKLAGCQVDFAESDLFAAVKSREDIDLVVSNPPYIASSEGSDVPMYAAGGAEQGLALPLRIVSEGIQVLAEGGLLMIYTGLPVFYEKPGHDPFLQRIREVEGAELVAYRIIHPDMFGEELSSPPYADTGRIQVVGAVMRRMRR
ncbi:hypothetical protein H2201_002796 [Coniosporium apollinis]|uniref:Methyltransferase small domain-containing protein n=1 Tax=Coniosporium apollinis TaxID=61459 RepID=A0ABQ9NZ17_9PEZI|nr:hypothetical protein H2201_002796 [Coniosporium apollinis]